MSTQRIHPSDITTFIRQLATLIQSGISIIHSCDILEKSQEKSSLRLLIYAIKKEILTGKNLHACLERYPHYFDELTRQLIEISEHTGRLDSMLTQVAEHLEKKLAFKKRLQQALFYPAILLLSASTITLGMLLFIVPRFAELFNDSTTPLPLLTHLIFNTALQLRHHGLLIVMIIGTLSITLFKFRRPLSFTSRLHSKNLMLAQFTRQLAITLTAGMPLLSAIELTSRAYHHPTFTHAFSSLQHQLRAGMQLHQAMGQSLLFPALMIQMIKVGEESGTLNVMLHKIAEHYEAIVEARLVRLNQLLEPLIMLVLGALIGGLVIGLYLPIFNMGRFY